LVISVCVGAILDLCVGRFGHPKRPNRGRFGLITWAVFDIRVGRFGHFPVGCIAVCRACRLHVFADCGVYGLDKNDSSIFPSDRGETGPMSNAVLYL